MDLQPNKIDGIFLPITNNRISASEWNQLVGSCMAFITAAGFTPDGADNQQFLNAFKKIAAELELVGANTALSNLSADGNLKFYARAFTPLNITVASGNAGIAGTYTLSVLPNDGKIRLAYLECSIQLSSSVSNYSAMSLSSDVFENGATVCGINNGFKITVLICLPVRQQIVIGFPHIDGGIDAAQVTLKGFF